MKRKRVLAAAGSLLAVCAAWLVFAWLRARVIAPSDNQELPAFSNGLRLLVLAPHCDDETLGAGGLIQAALRLGVEVRVVIATNGDGYVFATMQEFRQLFPSRSNYIRLGEVRQQESLAAMSVLGLPEEDVAFLGYPDRGTPSLWNDVWERKRPYRSPYTGSTSSPYPSTYDAQAVYAGESLLGDLTAILYDFRPDVVIYPHPDDVHPDHWGLSVFTRLALAQVERDDPSFGPQAYAYLVHRPDFPTPKKYLPSSDLVPPTALSRVSPSWFRFDLTPDETLTKWQALLQYRSQLGFLRGLFESFVRRNELFERRDSVGLPQLAGGDPSDPRTWRDPSGTPIAPIVLDPVKDFIVRDAVAAADLVATYAARTPEGRLVTCLELRGSTNTHLHYTLRAIGFAADGSRHPSVNHIDKGRGRFVCTQTTFDELGDPWVIMVGGEVRGQEVGILDQIAWELVLP